MSDLFPAELRLAICAYIHTSCIPPPIPSLDPLVPHLSHGAPTALPSSMPPASWPEPVARKTLAQLCLVNRAWYQAAKPWLWDKLEVRLPRTFLSMVEGIAWDYDEETVDMVMSNTIRAATQAVIRSSSPHDAHDLEERIISCLNAPDESIPIELLSPVASREPSPRRLRTKSKSPARWEILRSISDTIQTLLDLRDPGIYIPTPDDPRPGRFVRHLDFNHFRTLGMRRSVGEGLNSPFVTSHRVEAMIKEMPNLLVFGATEFMDSSLNLRILNELFLRGTPSRGRGRPTRGRALLDPHDAEEEDRERRRDCRELQAVDLTGCISTVFVNALDEFAATHLLPLEGVEAVSSPRMSLDEPLVFPGLQRLGMRGVKSVPSRTLAAFVLAFPALTHLDLSGTRVSPELLYGLSASTTVRLQSLALARCVKLTGDSITDLLVNSLATKELKELNLYGDLTYSSPLSEENLVSLFTEAPCFVLGTLIYLDLSAAPITCDVLAKAPIQPRLRSLGLSHIANLELRAVQEFLRTKATNVEVLSLSGTCPELDCGARGGSARQASISLHTHLIRPLCTPPFSFSISSPAAGTLPPPTNLRVVELAPAMLNALGQGAGAWRIIRSKGGRGWYVDTASGWIAGVLRRDLPKDHDWRRSLEQLSEANGNVTSGIGWHARKMEILYGHGMLGHEDGLYGAVSFAYQG
ncbi:hypothetical protein MIND_00245300 [Mycena indigotica]|uniref:F-box domain-containing protein n=1 Tax=Mycena indigotica TaxID=2126181 RepID=A0A8H6T8J8_9AGAR|nr:uncharacterized protein MIND_00245300 [Mycena indigotica]KAF7312322.1 hypothetical protein MIND_00245300 [Mycena indigotica]